jgi:hypothetical protein
MKAKLKPLEGKYYGTIIEINFDDGNEGEVIKLWNNDDRTPSERELKKCGDDTDIDDITCDNHYESELTHQRALKIINALNS